MHAFNGKPILIKPINPAVFRWGGEYSPILTGPMNKGSSEPFPLPSTISGLLYWISQDDEETRTGGETELDIREDYKTISKVEIFGPFFYAKGRDENNKDKICLAIHQYPKKLTIINEECDKERTFEPVYISKIGIGHDISKKQAHTEKGLIYTVEYIDYYATAVEKLGLKEVEEYGILVYTNAEIKEGFYPFGSEGRVVEVKKVNEDVLKNVKTFNSRLYILSPIILKANESPSPLVISSDVDNLIVDENGGKRITVKDLAFDTIRLSLIGLGFNVKYNVKRPIYLAIMPGKIEVKEKFKDLLDKLSASSSSRFVKLGLFDKIWGSVLIGGGYGG